MSIHKYFLILLAFCLPLTITACGGDDDDSLGGGQSQQDGDQGTQYATVASEKANLELYGEFDADKTKEVGGDTPALLLDDSGIEYSALGMSLPEQQALPGQFKPTQASRMPLPPGLRVPWTV
jgi:hypothetical protein